MRDYLKSLWKHLSWEVSIFTKSDFKAWWDFKLMLRLIRMKWSEETWRYLAFIIPNKLRYFVVIDAWAKATTGPYGNTNASTLTIHDALTRLEAPHGMPV